jgi:hypothetical protein
MRFLVAGSNLWVPSCFLFFVFLHTLESRLAYTTRFGCQALAFREVQPASFSFRYISIEEITN